MAIGTIGIVDKVGLDNAVISAAQTLRNSLDRIAILKRYLDTQTEAALIEVGYTSNDVAIIKSIATDLSKLAQVAHGTDTATPAYDFFTFVTPVLGIQ